MDYKKKIEKMKNHLNDHPADYQTRISLMKNQSKAIDAERRKQEIKRVRKVAEVRRKMKEGYYA